MLCFEVLVCVFEAGTLTSLPHTQQCDLSGSCTVSAQVMARGDRNIYVPILKSEENPAAFANDACFGLFDPSEHPDEYDDLDLAKVIGCLTIVFLSVDWIMVCNTTFSFIHVLFMSLPYAVSLFACFTLYQIHYLLPSLRSCFIWCPLIVRGAECSRANSLFISRRRRQAVVVFRMALPKAWMEVGGGRRDGALLCVCVGT